MGHPSELRKAVTRARKRNHITGPANREQMMIVGEAHAEIDDPRAKRIVTDYLEQSPITVPDLRDMYPPPTVRPTRHHVAHLYVGQH